MREARKRIGSQRTIRATWLLDARTGQRPRRKWAAELPEWSRAIGRALMMPAALTMLATLLPLTASADDWAQFRGPNAAGVSQGREPLPVEFSHQQNVLWKHDLGKGIASPIIAGGKVCSTAMVGDQTFAVFCFDAASGEPLWRKEFETGELPAIMSPNEHASSTPASDGQRCYVYFSTLGLLALDMRDGQVVWHHKLPLPQYLLSWGAAHSPIVYKDLVIFNQDDDRDPFLLALDKRTGEVKWKTPRPEMLAGYAVPVICPTETGDEIVIAGSGKLKGYDPETGQELWACNSLLRTIMTSPAVVGDVVYVSVQSYGDTDRTLKYALLQWKDTNQDGKLDKTEVDKSFWEKFDSGDADRDGFLVDGEIDAAFQAKTNMAGGGNTIQAVRGGGRGDVTKTHLLWNLDHAAPSNIASPLVVDDRLFVVKKGGISACFKAGDGETLWLKERIRNFGNYYASPIAGDGKLYVLGENGFLVVLKQSDSLEILAKNDMGESCIATPAIADGRVYVRTLNKLYCFSAESR